MVAAWVIICVRICASNTLPYRFSDNPPNSRSQNHLEETKRDLALITNRKIPDWVDALIYGTVLIFWSFTAVQVRRRQSTHTSSHRNTDISSPRIRRSSSNRSRRASSSVCARAYAFPLAAAHANRARRHRAHLLRALADGEALPWMVRRSPFFVSRLPSQPHVP